MKKTAFDNITSGTVIVLLIGIVLLALFIRWARKQK
jgi:hypothetical protein